MLFKTLAQSGVQQLLRQSAGQNSCSAALLTAANKSVQRYSSVQAGSLKKRSSQHHDRPSFSYFWNKEQVKEQTVVSVDTAKKDDVLNPSSWDSLGFLMEKFHEESASKKRLLPDQDPKYHGKLTVVLELDEILLYTFVPDDHEAYINAPLKDHDYYFELTEYDLYLSVYRRPGLDEFLTYLRENTEPILFTKGVKAYAEKVLKLIDPEGNTFAHVLSNEDCDKIVYPPEDMDEYVKDIGRLNRDLKRLVYVDSQPISFWSAPDNALPISSYYAELHDEDTQLADLQKELTFLADLEDVRTVLVDEFKVRETLKQSRFL